MPVKHGNWEGRMGEPDIDAEHMTKAAERRLARMSSVVTTANRMAELLFASDLSDGQRRAAVQVLTTIVNMVEK